MRAIHYQQEFKLVTPSANSDANLEYRRAYIHALMCALSLIGSLKLNELVINFLSKSIKFNDGISNVYYL